MDTVKLLKWISWFGVSTTLLIWSVMPAHAGIGISPKPTASEPTRSWFVYTLQSGESREDSVILNNHSDKPITLMVEGLDAINTTSGGFTLVNDVTKNQDLGNWVTLETNTVQLNPEQSKEVKFKITVPEGASVGDHSGAIAVYEKPVGNASSMGLKIRVGARIYVTVPGKVVRKIQFDKVSHTITDGKLTFQIEAKNQSNINLEPALEIAMTGLRTIRQTDDLNGQYLSGSPIKFTTVWQHSAPRIGYYRIQAILHTWSAEEVLPDGTKNQLPDMKFVYRYGFWVGGWYIFWLAVLLVLGWLTYRLVAYWRDRRKFRTKITIQIVKKSETVMHISEATGIFPQAIVRFNHLEWPYALNAGDKLMIPTCLLTSEEFNRKIQTEFMPSFWKYLFSYQSSLYHPSNSRAISNGRRSADSSRSVRRKPIKRSVR